MQIEQIVRLKPSFDVEQTIWFESPFADAKESIWLDDHVDAAPLAPGRPEGSVIPLSVRPQLAGRHTEHGAEPGRLQIICWTC